MLLLDIFAPNQINNWTRNLRVKMCHFFVYRSPSVYLSYLELDLERVHLFFPCQFQIFDIKEG